MTAVAPPGFDNAYTMPQEEAAGGGGVFGLVGSLVTDPFILHAIGTGLIGGRGMVAKAIGVKGGVGFSKHHVTQRVSKAVQRSVGSTKYRQMATRNATDLAQNKYKHMDMSKLSPAQQVKFKNKMLGEAADKTNAHFAKQDKAIRKLIKQTTKTTEKTMYRTNRRLLRTKLRPGAKMTGARVAGQAGRMMKGVAGLMIAGEIGGFFAGQFREAAIKGRAARGFDDFSPNEGLGNSQEAYTQRTEALQTMSRMPGFVQRQGTEARMYHT